MKLFAVCLISAALRLPSQRHSGSPRSAKAILWTLVFARAFALDGAAQARQSDESPNIVCVSLAGEKQIQIYRQKEDSGALGLAGQSPTLAEPGFLAANRAGDKLFAAYRSSGEIASYKMDSQTGGIQLISVISAEANPAYLALDHSESFLLSAYYRAGKVGVHPINRQGALSPEAVHWHPTAPKAHAILVHRDNQWAYVPHTGPNAIYIFSFDAKSGRLSPASPPFVRTEVGTGPRHLQFHHQLDCLYFDNEQGSSVSVFGLDRNTGQIRLRQSLSTLPANFDSPNTCSDLEITPDGRFLYVANRGHDSIAGFRISPKTGRLQSIGQFPTETTPRSFAVTPCGKWLVAAGQTSGHLQVSEIQSDSGRLLPRHRIKAGSRPWSVLAIRRASQ